MTVHPPLPYAWPHIGAIVVRDQIAVIVNGIKLEQPAWRPGLVFGYKLASELDPDSELHEQTIGRCKAAARAFRDREVHDLFIVCRIENGGLRMAELMKACLLNEKVPPERVHLIDAGFVTNTVSEVQVFLEVLKHVTLPKDCATEIMIHSSWYHLRRIKKIFKNFGVQVRNWNSTSKCSFLDLAAEVLKILLLWAIPGYSGSKQEIKLPDWVTSTSPEAPSTVPC
jgi:uncharacterized SAM-binding protein YcdF (DUF218 family)